MGVVISGCGSSPAVSAPVDLTWVASYYVRADGSDANSGISEAAPFKTLAKAVDAAAKTPVKKITVLGTLVENTKIEKTDPTVRGTKTDPAAKTKTITINWSLDEQDPDEILITGKPDASAAERAVLTPAIKDKYILLIMSSTVRLEHIEISGLNAPEKIKDDVAAVMVVGGNLTLAQGAKITKNSCYSHAGIYAIVGVVVMRDDAEISHNEGKSYAGVMFGSGSIGIMLDKTRIAGDRRRRRRCLERFKFAHER
jgi:hypothetical protein